MFVAPAMARRDWQAMLADLRHLCRAGGGVSAADSVLLVPLDEEELPDITVLGSNNVLPLLQGGVLKIML